MGGLLLPGVIFLGISQFTFLFVPDPANSPICPTTEVRGKMAYAMSCLEEIPGYNDMFLNLMQPGRGPLQYRIVKEICTLKPKIQDCTAKMMHNITNCINPKLFEGIEVWKKIDKGVSDYVCKNNAEIAYNIFVKTEKACWDTGVTDSLRKCAAEMNITTSMYDIHELVKQCKKIDEFQYCMMKNLGEVCPQNAVDSAEPIFRIVADNLCKDTNMVKKK